MLRCLKISRKWLPLVVLRIKRWEQGGREYSSFQTTEPRNQEQENSCTGYVSSFLLFSGGISIAKSRGKGNHHGCLGNKEGCGMNWKISLEIGNGESSTGLLEFKLLTWLILSVSHLLLKYYLIKIFISLWNPRVSPTVITYCLLIFPILKVTFGVFQTIYHLSITMMLSIYINSTLPSKKIKRMEDVNEVRLP